LIVFIFWVRCLIFFCGCFCKCFFCLGGLVSIGKGKRAREKERRGGVERERGEGREKEEGWVGVCFGGVGKG